MKFEFTENSIKSLKKLDKTIQLRILSKLKYWSSLENPLLNSINLEGHSKVFRHRIGNLRIILSPNEESGMIDILEIGHRSEIYKNL